MLCKKCGKQLPIAGKFCPFCGAPTEQIGVNDETAVFTPIPEEQAPIDVTAFSEVLSDNAPASRETESSAVQPSARAPQRLDSAQRPSGPRTTYFDDDDTPYRKPTAAKKGGIILLVIVLVAALIGGGIWFAASRKPDENLTQAEKYMQRGKFEDALSAYQAALADAKDPAEIQLLINQLTDYLAAIDYIDNAQYAQAMALLDGLSGRVDALSPLADAIDAAKEKARTEEKSTNFKDDTDQISSYISEKKYDQADALLSTLEMDSSLTESQRSQISALREELTQAQEAASRQEQTQQEQQKQKQSFADRMDKLEEDDKKIASAPTPEEELVAVSTSFEAWDTLLADIYDYLETSLSAEAYATEEAAYAAWVKERDDGAASAAAGNTDETSASLAKVSFQQSYTKARCYKLLKDMV